MDMKKIGLGIIIIAGGVTLFVILFLIRSSYISVEENKPESEALPVRGDVESDIVLRYRSRYMTSGVHDDCKGGRSVGDAYREELVVASLGWLID